MEVIEVLNTLYFIDFGLKKIYIIMSNCTFELIVLSILPTDWTF